MRQKISVVLVLGSVGFCIVGSMPMQAYSQAEDIPEETIDMTLHLTNAEIRALQEIGLTDERVLQRINDKPYDITCCGFGGDPRAKAKYFSFWINTDDKVIAIAIDLEEYAVSNIVTSSVTHLGETVEIQSDRLPYELPDGTVDLGVRAPVETVRIQQRNANLNTFALIMVLAIISGVCSFTFNKQ
ncbi:MAG: hypothetical protein QXU32_05085 [Nitrososphaerales archaeon]